MAAHFVRELVEDKRITVEYINTKAQLADCMTKCLGKQQHQQLSNSMKLNTEIS